MASDKKVKIQFETKADTKGAKDTKKAVDDVVNSEKQLNNASEVATNSIAGMRAEVTRLTSELEKAEIGSDDFLLKARQLDAVQTKLDGTLRTSGAGFKNVGSLIGQAGFQVQDFAVQVGAGTSALTALSQQGSQLLGMFGPTGAVAGALLAIGAIAAKVFVPAEVEMGRFLGDIEELAKFAAEGISENFDKVLEGIEKQAARATELANLYDGVREASDRYSQSELANADKRREALVIINQLLGVQRDMLKELQEQQDSEADKRRLTSQQQIAAQNEIADKAKAAIEIKNATLLSDSEVLANARNQLALEQRKLEVYRQQKAELEAQVRNAPSALENISAAGFANTTIKERQQNARRAKEILGSEGPQLNVENSEAKVSELESRIKSLEKTLSGVAAGLVGQAERAEVIAANVQTEISRIAESSKTEELLATVENAKNTIETGNAQSLDLLKEVLAAAEPANESQRQAVTRITDLIRDSEISAKDAAQIASELPILMKAINATNQKALDQVSVLINLMGIQAQNQTSIDNRLRQLERQIANSRGN